MNKALWQHRRLVVVLLALLVGPWIGCATGKNGFRGDPEAYEVEKRLYEIDQALNRDEAGNALKMMNSLDEYVRKNRKVIELHPEASMMFSRVDASKRRLREVQKRVAERDEANAKASVEADVRRPLVSAAEVAERLNSAEPTTADLLALRKFIGNAQDALNEARRQNKVEIGGEFEAEIESRLSALRDTSVRAERVIKVVNARDELRDAMRAIELADSRQSPDEKLGDYASAQTKLNACQEIVDKIIADDPNMAAHIIALDDKTPAVKLKDIGKRCKKEQTGIAKLVKAADKEKATLEALQAYAADKSLAQQEVLKKWGRRPDISRAKKGKRTWIYIEKKKYQKGRRIRKETYHHEYVFDKQGALVDEKTKKR